MLKSEEELLRDHRKEQERKAKATQGGGAAGGGGGGQEEEDLAGTLRACQHCDGLLAARLQAVRQKVIKPTVVLLYEV